MGKRERSTGKRQDKMQVSLAMSSHLITDLYASFIIGLIPILALKFGLSIFLVSLLTSITHISNSLTQPVFGYLSDKYNARYFLIAGPFFSAVMISLIPIIPDYYAVLALLFIGNLSISAMHPGTAAMGGRFGGRYKGLSNSLISFSGTVGYAFGSIFIIFVIEKIGVSFTPFTMVPGIIMAVILFRFVKTSQTINRDGATANFFLRLKKIKKIKILQLFIIFAASFARDILWLTLITFMPLYFTDKGITLLNIGMILTAYTLIGGVGGIFTGLISDRMKHKYILILVGLLASTPFIYLIFRSGGILPIIFFIITGFFSISTLPVCIRLSQDIFPSNISLASSLVMGLSVGLASIVLMFLGRLADIIGIPNTVSIVVVILFAASALLVSYPFIAKKAAHPKMDS